MDLNGIPDLDASIAELDRLFSREILSEVFEFRRCGDLELDHIRSL